MFGLIGYVGSIVKDVVVSNNKRDVDICHDNNHTKIEISKIVLGGVAFIGTLALQFYNNKNNNHKILMTVNKLRESKHIPLT